MDTSQMHTFQLLELPQPLVEDILLLALDNTLDQPCNVFLLCRRIYEYLRPKFLKHVRLMSIEQVKAFAESEGIIKYGGEVKTLKIQVGGAVTNPGGSKILGQAITLVPNVEQVDLILFSLRVDIYRQNLIDGLRSINPKRFTWTSPDPDHQFIIAIFSSHLPYCLSQYTNLRHLSLSNISFAPLSDPSRGEPPYHGWNTFELSTELKKHLEVIEIKRAVFVEPRVIVDLLEMERSEGHGKGESVHEMMQRYLATFKVPETQKQLEAVMARSHDDEEEETVGCKVILEDVYLESIWGPRLRMWNLLQEVRLRGLDEKILRRVEIRSRFERIQGGDRDEL
ncbi:hypothetical protein QFC20_001496 [Naganishia adeliensis]|uniref:Uncharacterized protein n=1 Tax=Naganishia adeliensis TaxID=92952 RepID=A0ACC2WRE7_9TREE|nr:hypothetical protein QFC20_001496 [Naganishia adeliensis]